MVRYKNLRRVSLLKWILILFIVLFTVSQVLEVFVEVNYSAIPRYVMKKLGSSRSVSSSELLLPNANRVKNGYPRVQCACDSQTTTAHHIQNPNVSSTCSREASEAGVGQKVVSYSLFMRDPEAAAFFLEGVDPNLSRIRSIFPGWLVRIYTDLPLNQYTCPFVCKYPFLFWCDIKNIPLLGDLSGVNGRVWRYLPVGDPTVDLMISRDLDSTASEREQAAVSEWETSNKTVHVLRDSQWHDTQILAGLWGLKNYGLQPGLALQLQQTLMRVGGKKQSKFWDQDLAEKYIYFPFKTEVLAHDSYYCGKYPDGLVRPFPTQRQGEEFVGHDDRKEMNRLLVGRLDVCPEKCRPMYGKSWKYC